MFESFKSFKDTAVIMLVYEYTNIIIGLQMNKKSFWVTNVSSRNVSLTDLNLTIKAFSSVNLLDTRHYSYNLQQLQESVEKGSIYKKRDKIVVRKLKPENIFVNVPFNHETYIPNRQRSVLNIKQEKYEELNISDEVFADENAEIAEQDRQLHYKLSK